MHMKVRPKGFEVETIGTKLKKILPIHKGWFISISGRTDIMICGLTFSMLEYLKSSQQGFPPPSQLFLDGWLLPRSNGVMLEGEGWKHWGKASSEEIVSK